MTVAELQERIAHREMIEWQAFYNVEPWGERRADMQTAMVAQILANSHRDAKRRARPFEMVDFLFDFWQDAARDHARALRTKFRGILATINHDDTR